MLDTPRTTLVAAIVQGTSATWVHCGDSRLYVVRNGELLTRTRDHSYLEQQNGAPAGVVRMDRINRNILFTCLGSPTKPVFDVTGPVALQQGDKILLCSDGLWSSVPDQDIVNALSAKPVSDAAPDLVETALRNGGDHSDNVTVVALEWETPDTFESTRGISTDSIMDGVFASTIQAGVLDTMVEDLDDAAIERSIAEINEAIRRSNGRKN
jgi:PPM family protein phosphatase